LTSRPATLSDLRVAVLAADPHLAALQRACQVLDVRREDWRKEPPHLALIESSGLRRGRGGTGRVAEEKFERALALLSWCEQRGIATALWETSLLRRIKTPTALLQRAQHLFVADPEAANELEGRRPLQLPLAAQVVPESRPTYSQRPHQIAFVERWPRSFSGRRRQQLEAIMDVASENGLVIFRPERSTDTALPERFSSFVIRVPSDRAAIESLGNARMVLGADPSNHGRLMVPQLVFDALAAGSVVIAPNDVGVRRLFGDYFAVIVRTPDDAAAAIERFLRDEEEWTEKSSAARIAILNAHTYPHRIATIASAAGFRLLPALERVTPL
jgi:Glycosyl transferases group 1